MCWFFLFSCRKQWSQMCPQMSCTCSECRLYVSMTCAATSAKRYSSEVQWTPCIFTVHKFKKELAKRCCQSCWKRIRVQPSRKLRWSDNPDRVFFCVCIYCIYLLYLFWMEMLYHNFEIILNASGIIVYVYNLKSGFILLIAIRPSMRLSDTDSH